MNINKIQLHITANDNITTKEPHLRFIKYNKNILNNDSVSFSSNSTEYKATIEKLDKKLQDELDRLKKAEEDTTVKYANVRDRIILKEDIVNKISNLTSEYQAINEMLSTTKKEHIADSANIAMDFLEAMNHLGLDKGFNRISGYKDVKKFLKSKFIFSSILRDRIAENTNVPNTLFFYGPTNTGKSTFAIALAEQSLSVPTIVETAKFKTQKDLMDKIEEEAILSKEHYDKTKQRSIIIINEAENFLSDDEEVINRFIKFSKDCAKKYKCTVFLTTNYAKRIDPRILSSSTTPYKIAINPMEQDDCYELIKNRINMGNKRLTNEEIRILINRLFQNPNERYSNGAIICLFNLVWKRNHNPTLQDYLNILKSDNGEVEPDITLEELNDYKALKKEFSKDSL